MTFLLSLSVAALLGSTALCAAANAIAPADTTLRVDNKLITLNERNNRLDVTVHRITHSGDTTQTKRIFRGIYDTNRTEEQTVLDQINIPFIRKKSRSSRLYPHVDVGALGFGFSGLHLSGQTKHFNLSNSSRFTLGVLHANLRYRYVAFKLGTSFDFNKIKIMDGYTLQRNTDDVSVMVPPLNGESFRKNRLAVTYFNMYSEIKVNPFTELKGFYIKGYAGLKLKTASGVKAWRSDGGRSSYNGDSGLRTAVPEIGGGIGYHFVGLMITHTLTSIYLPGKGPDLKLTAFGVQLFF